MRINLPATYSQIGNNTPIGSSTINNIGCLTVDGAMAATYFGHAIDPSTLAKQIKYSGNLWVWSELSRIFPDIKYTHPVRTSNIPRDLNDSEMNEIRGAIDSGWPVFIKIVTPKIPEHWLLGVDYEGDDIICADPLKPNGAPHKITDYGIAPKTVIYNYGWYTGPKPISDDALAVCMRDREKFWKERDALQSKNDELVKSIEVMRSDYDTKLANKDKECQDKILEYKNSLKKSIIDILDKSL